MTGGHPPATAAPRVESRTRSALWRAVFLVSFPFGILGFVLPVYGRALGASALEVGAFFSAFAVFPIVIRPFLGRALDRWGRRPFLLLGLLGYLAAALAFAFATSVWMLTAARFVQGLGSAFLWLTAYTMVADLSDAGGRGLGFGLIDEATNRGAIIGTTIGFTVIITLQRAGEQDWRKTWWALFVVFAVTAGAALAVAWRGAGETRPPSPAPPSATHPVSRRLATLMAIVLLTGASSAMVWPLLVVFLQDSLSADVRAIATAYLPAALIGAFLPSRLGNVSDRFGRKKPMIAGLLVGAAASAVVPELRSLAGLAAVWAVESAGYAASIPAERAFVADIAGEDMRGASYGLYTFASFLGAAIGPIVGGWLYDRVSPATPFYLNAAALALGAALVALALREPGREAAPAQGTV
jgi:MFS family permease